MDFAEKEKLRKRDMGVVSKIVGSTNEVGSKKKVGRPKLNRETKKRFTLTLLPSNYDNAMKIANNEGKSMSELVDELLEKYIKKNTGK